MWAGAYLLTAFGLYSAAFGYEPRRITAIALIFVLSRSLSGICAVTCKSAKKEGTLQSFVRPAHRNITIAMDVIFLAAAAGIMIYISAVGGIICVIAAIAIYILCIRRAAREFGGITGDVLGWGLQLCELVCLAAAVITAKLLELGR